MMFAACCASALAKPGYVTFQGERKSQFTISGTRGFRITVERIGKRVELVASNGNSAAIYIVHSPATLDADIHARFPGVGVVSTHFKPSGATSRTPAICGGGPSIRQDGVFRGTIKFRGERGFTRAKVDSAHGFFFREPKENCKGKGHSGQSSRPIYSLTARTRVPGGCARLCCQQVAAGFGIRGAHGLLRRRVETSARNAQQPSCSCQLLVGNRLRNGRARKPSRSRHHLAPGAIQRYGELQLDFSFVGGMDWGSHGGTARGRVGAADRPTVQIAALLWSSLRWSAWSGRLRKPTEQRSSSAPACWTITRTALVQISPKRPQTGG